MARRRGPFNSLRRFLSPFQSPAISANNEQVHSAEPSQPSVERHELRLAGDRKRSQVRIGPAFVRRCILRGKSAKRGIEVGWLDEEDHARVIEESFVCLPCLGLGLDESAHDPGIRQVPEESHLRDATERARLLGLPVEPRLGARVMLVIGKRERQPHIGIQQTSRPRGWHPILVA